MLFPSFFSRLISVYLEVSPYNVSLCLSWILYISLLRTFGCSVWILVRYCSLKSINFCQDAVSYFHFSTHFFSPSNQWLFCFIFIEGLVNMLFIRPVQVFVFDLLLKIVSFVLSDLPTLILRRFSTVFVVVLMVLLTFYALVLFMFSITSVQLFFQICYFNHELYFRWVSYASYRSAHL